MEPETSSVPVVAGMKTEVVGDDGGDIKLPIQTFTMQENDHSLVERSSLQFVPDVKTLTACGDDDNPKSLAVAWMKTEETSDDESDLKLPKQPFMVHDEVVNAHFLPERPSLLSVSGVKSEATLTRGHEDSLKSLTNNPLSLQEHNDTWNDHSSNTDDHIYLPDSKANVLGAVKVEPAMIFQNNCSTSEVLAISSEGTSTSLSSGPDHELNVDKRSLSVAEYPEGMSTISSAESFSSQNIVGNRTEQRDSDEDDESQHSSNKQQICSVDANACDPCYQVNSMESDTDGGSHTGPYLVCLICSKEFSTTQSLKRHKLIHAVDNPCKCDVCGKSFSSSSHLKSHVRAYTEDEPYKCTVCAESFKLSCHLKTHGTSDTGEKPYYCRFCSKGFLRERSAKNHEKSHTDPKPVCNICSKTFSTSAYLKKHQIIHTVDNPFKCDICAKGFYSSYQLKLHLRNHNDKKSYVCKFCPKRFSRPVALMCHENTHTAPKPARERKDTGPKPRCEICSKQYASTDSLKRHKKIHAGENPYKFGLGENF